jgi:hypothetical protein
MAEGWRMGALARMDQYEGLPMSNNIEDRRPTSLHEFSAREPVLVQGYTDPARGWGDMIDKNALMLDAKDMTFGQPDQYGFSEALGMHQQRNMQPFPHPLKINPADEFEGRLERQEFMDAMNRSMDKAIRENPNWLEKQMNKPITQLSDEELAKMTEMMNPPEQIDPFAGPAVGDETN